MLVYSPFVTYFAERTVEIRESTLLPIPISVASYWFILGSIQPDRKHWSRRSWHIWQRVSQCALWTSLKHVRMRKAKLCAKNYHPHQLGDFWTIATSCNKWDWVDTVNFGHEPDFPYRLQISWRSQWAKPTGDNLEGQWAINAYIFNDDWGSFASHIWVSKVMQDGRGIKWWASPKPLCYFFRQ